MDRREGVVEDEPYSDQREPYTPTESISDPPPSIFPPYTDTTGTVASTTTMSLNGNNVVGSGAIVSMKSPLLGTESSMGVPPPHTAATLPTRPRSVHASQAVAWDVHYTTCSNARVCFGCACCMCTGCLSCIPCCVWSVCIHPPLGGPPSCDPMK